MSLFVHLCKNAQFGNGVIMFSIKALKDTLAYEWTVNLSGYYINYYERSSDQSVQC